MFLRFSFLTTLFVALCNVSPASATAFTVYVGSNGGNTTNCGEGPGSPCVTIDYALQYTGVGGTIICVSPPLQSTLLNITASVTIDCKGAKVAQVKINLPTNDSFQRVHIRGLVMNPVSSTTGPLLEIVAAQTVVLQDMTIQGGLGAGVYDHASVGNLVVKDSVIENNGGPGLTLGGFTNNATLEGVTSIGNAYGVAVAALNNLVVLRSTIAYNTTSGVEADGGSFVIVDGSTINRNVTGIQSGSAIRLSNNNIMFNQTAVSGATGSFGNNRFSGNNSDGTALTPVGASSTDLAQK